MKLKIAHSAKIFIAAFLVITAFNACDNNDTNETAETTTETITDTMQTVVTPPADTMRVDNSSTMMTTTKPGIAKPNPAKKGLKGKVTASPEMPATKDAKMEADASGVYPIVDVMAAFPDGTKGLQSYFDKNLEYPAEASNEGVEGTVKVTFVVDENGRLIAPQVTGENLGYGLEEEALRVIKRMPSWSPAKVKGKNVKTRITLPIRFQLI